MLKSLANQWRETATIYGRIMERNRSWFDLYNQGGGTALDFIRADFGTTQPNGLDALSPPDYEIKFSKDRRTSAGGYVKYGEYEVIHLNARSSTPLSLRIQAVRNFLSDFSVPIIDTSVYGHEFTHTLQFFKERSGWIDAKQRIADNIPAADGFWQRQIDWVRRKSLDGFNSDHNIKDYYSNNLEMQARLHEIMVKGHSQWQALPTTKTELWAALHQVGINTPESIEEILYDTNEGQNALHKFQTRASIQSSAAAEISSFNKIQKYIGDRDTIESLWTNHIPLLYGELIEHYGDGPGRERMGLGINPRPVIDVLREVEILSDKGVKLNEEQIQAFAERIPAELAAPFINNLMKLKDSDNYSITDETYAEYLRVTNALLQREDVRKALFEPDHIVTDVNLDIDYRPPLLNANMHGNDEIFNLLLQNGANVNQSFSFTGEEGVHSLRDFREGSMAFINGEVKLPDSVGIRAWSQSIKSLFLSNTNNNDGDTTFIDNHRKRVERIDAALGKEAPLAATPSEELVL